MSGIAFFFVRGELEEDPTDLVTNGLLRLNYVIDAEPLPE
jgi:hypothetical protein